MRGRWPDASGLRVVIDPRFGPLSPSVFEREMRRALERWERTGAVSFEVVERGATAAVTLGWRSGDHDRCPPFGPTRAVAHSGPVEPGTFVHFDAGHTWEEGGVGRNSLYVTALHELGHVLGLGHSADSRSLMFADTTAIDLTPSDLRGLASLYGGEPLGGGAGDVVLQPAATPGDANAAAGIGSSLVLHGAAHGACTAAVLFDTGGDGDEELLVWRTDEAGAGALVIYRFDAGPVLAETRGPLWSRVHTGPFAEAYGAVTPDGQRLFVSTQPGLAPIVQRFTGEAELEGVGPNDSDVRRIQRWVSTAKLATVVAPDGSDAWTGDLDGDGREETLVRRR